MENTPPQPSQSETNNETRQCRICLSGPEDEHTSGRLIKPCMCKGSMQVSSSLHRFVMTDSYWLQYVHVKVPTSISTYLGLH